jgi:hypothetical protein
LSELLFADGTAFVCMGSVLLTAMKPGNAGSRTKFRFLATHEITTPTNGVIGMTVLPLGTGLGSDWFRNI